MNVFFMFTQKLIYVLKRTNYLYLCFLFKNEDENRRQRLHNCEYNIVT